MASHKDVTTLKNPKGGIINIALSDPSKLFINPTYGYLSMSESKSWVVNTLLGQTTYHSTTNIRQICITPFAHGWHRFVAVLAKVCQKPKLFFPSFKGGITFGTSRIEGESRANPKRRSKGSAAPIDGPVIRTDQNSKGTYKDVHCVSHIF